MNCFVWLFYQFKHIFQNIFKHNCKHEFEIIKKGEIYNEISIDDIKKILENVLNMPTPPIEQLYIGDDGIHTEYNQSNLNKFVEEFANIVKTGLSVQPIGYYVVFVCKKCNYLSINKMYFK